MARRSKPTFPIPQEVLDNAAVIKGAPQIAQLAGEVKRCIEEDEQSGDDAYAAICATKTFPDALDVAQRFVVFEIGDTE
jgi:hypothetical protein